MTDPSVSLTSKIELSGSFFTHDPVKSYRANIRDMLEALSVELEGQVKGEIEAHQGEMPRWSGWSRDHTKGYVIGAVSGRRWQYWAAAAAYTAGMDTKDARRTKAAAATIEKRWHPYRRVKAGVYRARALISADLAKGLE